MGRVVEEHDIGDERPGAAGETPGDEDGHGMRSTDEEPDADDEESLRRLEERLTKEHDRIAHMWERVNDAARPLGKIEIDPDQVIDARSMSELGRTSQLEPVQIDSRIERMDDEDNIPESEYGSLDEAKVRIVEGKIAEMEIAGMLNGGWIAVQRDQIEAIASTIDRTGINSAQAVAIIMVLVGTRIGECRMRDLIETMSQTTEVPTGQTQTYG